MEYVLALVMGFSLGLLGGGGSILTVPILVYIAGIQPVRATGYSLFIVGLTALIGTITNVRKSLVRFKEGLIFAVPSFAVVYSVRSFILPMIPETLMIGSLAIPKSMALMVFFSIVMLTAGISMLLPRKESDVSHSVNYVKIVLSGLFVGLITSFVGAGGGFLIVPSLILLLQIPIREAVATSLFIIALNSGIGFLGELSTGTSIEWGFLLQFVIVSIVGMLVGTFSSQKINPNNIKKIFAYFIIIMSIFIITKELFHY